MRPITTLTANNDLSVQMERAESSFVVMLVRFVPPVVTCVTIGRDCRCDSTALTINQ